MDIPPGLRRFLDLIGVNTTRLQWRLHEWERRRAERAESPSRPVGPRWARHAYKNCPSCGRLVPPADRACDHCGAALPSMPVYRVQRAMRLLVPSGAPVWTGFLIAIVGLVVFQLARERGDGFSGMLLTPSAGVLDRYGALFPPLVTAAGEYWRLFSAGLLHIGLLHLGFNVMALMQLGPLIEPVISSKRMFVVVTLGQLASGAAVVIFSPRGITAGASGWLCALIGFGIVYFHRHGGGARAVRDSLVQWAILLFFFGLAIPGISNSGHFGGMAGGAALGALAEVVQARRTLVARVWEGLFWPCVGLWIYVVASMARSIFG